jgi:hypothetical protein
MLLPLTSFPYISPYAIIITCDIKILFMSAELHGFSYFFAVGKNLEGKQTLSQIISEFAFGSYTL